MILRLAVREVESWLLADREGAARFLAVPPREIPSNPDDLPDPKRFLISLARRSERRSVIEALVPAPGSTARVGKLYVSELSSYALRGCDVKAAREQSSSLNACLQALERLPSA